MPLLRGRRGDDDSGTKYQMREKMFAIGDDYRIETDGGARVFKVNGKALRIRNTLVLAAGGVGADPAIRAEARRLALAWLDDHAAVPAESVSTVLALAALDGDEALYDRFAAALETEADRRNRRRLIGGLSSFHDPDLVRRTLGLLLDARFDPREVLTSLETRFWTPASFSDPPAADAWR